jgi:hypothetical protein
VTFSTRIQDMVSDVSKMLSSRLKQSRGKRTIKCNSVYAWKFPIYVHDIKSVEQEQISVMNCGGQ